MFACRKSTHRDFRGPKKFLIGAPLIALAVLKIELSTWIRAISVTRSIDCNGFSVLYHVFRVAHAPFVFTTVLEPFLALLQQPLLLSLFSSPFLSSHLISFLLFSPLVFFLNLFLGANQSQAWTSPDREQNCSARAHCPVSKCLHSCFYLASSSSIAYCTPAAAALCFSSAIL